MAAALAIGPDDVTKLGVGVTVALVVVALLVVLAVKAVVVRIVTLVVAVVLGVLVWQQRQRVEDAYTKQKCDLGVTYFGIHVDAPDSVRRACQAKGQALGA